MTDEPEKVDLETPDLAARKRAALLREFPGVLDDNVLDAAKLAEQLDVRVADVPDGRERYGLQWAGKQEAIKSLLTPSRGSLTPDLENSIDFDNAQNVFIEGDNLEVLKLLQKAYNDKIKLIYIDPPYNTGNDFVYNDDFSDGLRGYLEYTGQLDEEGNRTSTNVDSSGRRHSRWLSMMYPRLVLARNLLTQDGVIIVSIDENEITGLRMVLDEVFGAENFIAVLTVLCNPKGRSQDKYFAANHEYVVVYSRAEKPVGSFTLEKEADQIVADYPLQDEIGPYRLLELRNTHREFGRHNRPNLYYPVFVRPDGSVSLEASDGTEVLPEWPDGFEGCWTWGRQKATSELESLVGRESSGRLKIFRKDYGTGSRRMLKTILSDSRYTTESGQRAFNDVMGAKGKIFQSPKSPNLLMDLIATSTTGSDTVLDFFAGSGSAAHAVAMLNARDGGSRRAILVNLPEDVDGSSDAARAGFRVVSDITIARLHAVSTSVDTVGLGLRAFGLDEGNFRGDFTSEDQLDLAATTLAWETTDWDAVAAEILLKEGVQLDARWERPAVDGANAVVAGGIAVVLSDRLSEEMIEAALNLTPDVLVLLEDGFSGRDSLKANAVTNAKNHGITLKTV